MELIYLLCDKMIWKLQWEITFKWHISHRKRIQAFVSWIHVHNATHVSIVHPKTESGAWNFSILHMHWSSPNWHNIYRTAIAFRWKSILLPEQQNESAKDWKSLEIQTIDSIFLHSLKRAWNAEMGKCVRCYQWSKWFFFKEHIILHISIRR